MTTATRNWLNRRAGAVERATAAVRQIADADTNLAALRHDLFDDEAAELDAEIERQDAMLAEAVAGLCTPFAMEGGGR